MDTDMFDTVPPALNPSTLQILLGFAPRVSLQICNPSDVTTSITYNVSAPLTDLGFINEYHDVNDTGLVPVIQIAQPRVTKTIELEFMFDTMDDGTNHAMFNQVTYNPPLVPAIFSELTLGQNATVESAYGPLSFVIEHMDVVDIVVKNGDAGKHPL